MRYMRFRLYPVWGIFDFLWIFGKIQVRSFITFLAESSTNVPERSSSRSFQIVPDRSRIFFNKLWKQWMIKTRRMLSTKMRRFWTWRMDAMIQGRVRVNLMRAKTQILTHELRWVAKHPAKQAQPLWNKTLQLLHHPSHCQSQHSGVSRRQEPSQKPLLRRSQPKRYAALKSRLMRSNFTTYPSLIVSETFFQSVSRRSSLSL